jgi:hypothetical protein
MPRRSLALLAATLLGSGCNSKFPNPFENFHPTATPPPQATLFFTSNLYATRAGAARDVFAIADDGSGLTRLTSCNSGNDNCDAIEAAFLHDGPAIKKLGVIKELNGLTPKEILELRAFLYSL